MNFEKMGYQNIERPNKRQEYNDHVKYMDPFLDMELNEYIDNLAKEGALTKKESDEIYDAKRNGTIKEFLEKKREERKQQEELNRKIEKNIEQKVIKGEFVDTSDSNMASIQERKNEKMIREKFSTEQSITEINDEGIIDKSQLNEKSNTHSISKLEEFAKVVNDGQLTLKDAVEYLGLYKIKDIVNIRGNNDMDLLQIAIINNYNNLFNQIIDGIDIEKEEYHYVTGHHYASVNGSSKSSPPSYRRVTSIEHIDLFNEFDLFRKDSLGNNAINYAINNKDALRNIYMFYSIVEKTNDSRILDMTFTPPLGFGEQDLDLLNYLISLYIANGQSVKLLPPILKLMKKKDMFQKLFFGTGYSIQLLIDMDLSDSPTRFFNGKRSYIFYNLLDNILSICNKEERTYIWRYVIKEYFSDKIIKKGLQAASNLLELMERMLQYGVDIEKSDLDLINSISITSSNRDDCDLIDKSSVLESSKQKRANLFNYDINKLETLTGKSPDVLRAVLGENYLEKLKELIDKNPNNIDALKNAINGKWDTERNSRLFLFDNIGKIIGIPNKEGHTLFAALTCEEIIMIFDKYSPVVLTNEAILDLADKPIYIESYARRLNPLIVTKVYDAIYNYIPKENIEEFCDKILAKLQIDDDSLFSINGRLDRVFHYFTLDNEKVVDNLQHRFSKYGSQDEDSYCSKIKKIKTEAMEKKEQEQQKKINEKDIYIILQDLAKQIEELKEENKKLKEIIGKYDEEHYDVRK